MQQLDKDKCGVNFNCYLVLFDGILIFENNCNGSLESLFSFVDQQEKWTDNRFIGSLITLYGSYP